MKRLICKLVFMTSVFVGVNSAFCGYAAACGAQTIVPWKIGFPGLFVLFFLSGVLAEKFFPQENSAQKKVFIAVSLILFLLTLGVWGTILLMSILI